MDHLFPKKKDFDDAYRAIMGLNPAPNKLNIDWHHKYVDLEVETIALRQALLDARAEIAALLKILND